MEDEIREVMEINGNSKYFAQRRKVSNVTAFTYPKLIMRGKQNGTEQG